MIFNYFKKKGPLLRADIDVSEKFIIIQTMSSYGFSVTDPEGVCRTMNTTVSDKEVVNVLMEALQKSRELSASEYNKIVAEEKNGEAKKELESLIKKLGYKEKKEYYKGLRSISVEKDRCELRFIPSHQENLYGYGPTAGGEKDYVIIPADSSPEEIGKALRLAISRCTSVFDT
ncbi:MAG: CdiI family contact-dependent growth inhibition immunity protein [Alphaproteobacteria bacterium]|nr:MAG: CdiI family contact-dependent growth inhibition immunity protein [Alphaproteobacteria bacterium]